MNIEDLLEKVDDFNSLTQREQVKLMCYLFVTQNDKVAFRGTEIKEEFEKHHLSPPANINRELKALCNKEEGKVLIFQENGIYKFNMIAKKKLDQKFPLTIHTRKISQDLRLLLDKISSTEQRAFLEEAICCYEIKAYRSSIVMIWLLTMDSLITHVLNNGKDTFNSTQKISSKKRKVERKSDFEEFKENDILEAMRSANMLTKEQHKILNQKLDIRNSAAHPNSTTFKEPKVNSFIQELVEDIIINFL